jgi:Fe-S-cluster containining protein
MSSKPKKADCKSGPRRPHAASGRPARRHQPNGLEGWPINSCSCQSCQKACLNSPGWFTPNQLEPLAEFLRLSLEEVFRKYLAVGTTSLADRSRRHGVMPHKFQDRKKPGGLWLLAEMAQPGRCVFFDRGRCRIYPVRPFECARMIHSRTREASRLRQYVVKQWTLPKLKPFLAIARGRQPSAGEPESGLRKLDGELKRLRNRSQAARRNRPQGKS